MKDNVAFGTGKASAPQQGGQGGAPQASTSQPAHLEDGAKAAQDAAWQAARAARAAFESGQAEQSLPASGPNAGGAASASHVDTEVAGDPASEHRASPDAVVDLPQAAKEQLSRGAEAEMQEQTSNAAAPDNVTDLSSAQVPRDAVAAASSVTDRAAAARERFLARKRKAADPA